MMTLVNKLRISDVTCHWFSQKTQGNIPFATVTIQKLCSINLGNQLREILPWDDDIRRVIHASRKTFIILGCYLGIRHFSCGQKQGYCSSFPSSLDLRERLGPSSDFTVTSLKIPISQWITEYFCIFAPFPPTILLFTSLLFVFPVRQWVSWGEFSLLILCCSYGI